MDAETEFKPTDLGSMLGDEPAPDIQEPEQPAVEPEEPEATAQPENADADGVTDTEGEKPGEEPASEPPSDKAKADKIEPGEPATIPKARLDAEIAKRKDLEERLSRLEGKDGEKPEKPDILEDPEGYEQYLDTKLFTERCAISEELVKSSVGEQEYQKAYEAFEAAVSENPALGYQLRQAPNPAKFAYEQGRKHQFLAEIGNDPAAYKEKLKAELVAEIKAELTAEKPDETPAKPSPPKSLATKPSGPTSPGPGWQGPTPLEELL